MTCKHGEVIDDSDPPSAHETWKNRGEMTPILAILVENT